MTGKGPSAWDAEAAILASVIAHSPGPFTDAEKAHWTSRLMAALDRDREEQR